MFARGAPKSSAKVNVDHAVNSTIIGVLNGASPEQVDQILDEVHSLQGKLDTLLALPHTTENVRSSDPVADALFICSSGSTSAVAFAANHSGLLVCPTSVGEVEHATHLSSGVRYAVQPRTTGVALQSVAIEAETRGLVPAYWDWDSGPPDWDQPLWTFSHAGTRCKASLSGFSFDNVHVAGPDGGFVLNGVFEARYEAGQGLIGGPVLTGRDEVLGIGVAFASASSVLFAQPWAPLDRCIEMNAVVQAASGAS